MTRKVLIAVVLGLLAAYLFGERAASVGFIGTSIIQLVKIAATPLLFFTIVKALLEADLSWRVGKRVLRVALTNLAIACGIGLTFSNLFRPGEHFDAAWANGKLPAMKALPTLSWETFLTSLIPESVLAPFVKNDVLTIVLFALVVGVALRRARKEAGHSGPDLVPHWVREGLRTVEIVLGWVVKAVPIAVFAAVTKSLAEYGLAPLRGLLAYLAVGLAGLAVHSLLVYGFWISRVAKLPLRKFWRAAREPVVYAAGVNSSLATLPLTLRALKKLGVADEAAALGAGVATNLNNDGIILYEAMAVLFLAQAYGIPLDLPQQAAAAFACVAAGLGIAGIPEAGFISLSVVVVTLGLPTELLPLLLTVDWIIARARSVVNVLSDMTLSIVIDHWAASDSGREKRISA